MIAPTRKSRIETLLQVSFSPSLVVVEDESYKHAGHREAGDTGESHYKVLVVSEAFEGMLPVKRHQAIYKVLQPELDSGLHALSLELRTPTEYQ